jgi:serine/threonine protein kinase
MEKPLNYHDFFPDTGSSNYFQILGDDLFEKDYDYLSKTPLGKGAFGEVWKVENKKTKKQFACKKMFIRASTTTYFQADLNECKLEVYYSYIMSFYDIGPHIDTTQRVAYLKKDTDTTGTFYFIIELMDGVLTDYLIALSQKNLQDDFQDKADNVKNQIKKLIEKMIQHSLICHDFKSDNILYKNSPDGPILKLSDFGVKFCCEKSEIVQPQITKTACRLNRYQGGDKNLFNFIEIMLLACFEWVLLKNHLGLFLFQSDLTTFFKQIVSDSNFNNEFEKFLTLTQRYRDSIAWTSIHYMKSILKKDNLRKVKTVIPLYQETLIDTLKTYIYFSRFETPQKKLLISKKRLPDSFRRVFIDSKSQSQLLTSGKIDQTTIDNPGNIKLSYDTIIKKRIQEESAYMMRTLNLYGLMPRLISNKPFLQDSTQLVVPAVPPSQTLFQYVNSDSFDLQKLSTGIKSFINNLLDAGVIVSTLGPTRLSVHTQQDSSIKLGLISLKISSTYQIKPNYLLYGSFHLFEPFIYYLAKTMGRKEKALKNRARLLMYIGIWSQLWMSNKEKIPLSYFMTNKVKIIWQKKKDLPQLMSVFPQLLGVLLLGKSYQPQISLEEQLQPLFESLSA